MATVTYGAIVVPILQDFKPNDVHHIVNHSESTFLFTSDNIWENLEEEALSGLRAVFSLTDFRCLHQRDGETVQKFMKNIVTQFKLRPLALWPTDRDVPGQVAATLCYKHLLFHSLSMHILHILCNQFYRTVKLCCHRPILQPAPWR